MCGRYYINDEDPEMAEILEEIENKSYKTGEIFPTDTAPVLISKDKKIVPELFSWGYPGFKNKGVIINARSETLKEKNLFKESLYFKRCVIPSSGFFEWNSDKNKFLFNLPKSKSLYMAGLYNNDKKFVIITTKANSSIADIHNRMPLVLNKDFIDLWLNDTEFAINNLKETPPLLMKTAIKNP